MSASHPYVTSSKAISETIIKFRSALPPAIGADTLKRLALAPNNESNIISTLRFLSLLDEENKPTAEARKLFATHDTKKFNEHFSDIVKNAYSNMFSDHGEDAWSLSSDALIAFFRHTDNTGARVGERQARTFKVLASFCGHGESSEVKASMTPQKKEKSAKIRQNTPQVKGNKVADRTKPEKIDPLTSAERDFGLSVRIEINLPAVDDQSVYDKIFKSLRENLLNG